MALGVGTILIGKYTVSKVIGEGGFGVVYLAKEGLTGKTYAIKEYFPSQVCRRGSSGKVQLKNKDESHQRMFYKGLNRFKEEAAILYKIDHPNIIKVSEYFEENNTAFMVMPYIKGLSLEAFLKKEGRLSSEQADSILMPVLDAIGYIHEFGEGIIHRDINPGNILIDFERGEPILIDFGTSMGTGESDATQFVKHGYSAVEQYSTESSELLGFHTDIYSLAATFYHCLTGNKPANSTGRLLSDSIEELSEILAGQFDERLLKLIDLGLQLRPEQRPQSVEALKIEAGFIQPPEPPPPPPPPLQPQKAVGLPWLPIGIVGVVALIAVSAGFYFWSSDPVPTGPTVALSFDMTPESASVLIDGRAVSTNETLALEVGRKYRFKLGATDHEAVEFDLRPNNREGISLPESLTDGVASAKLGTGGSLAIALNKKTLPLELRANADEVEFQVIGQPAYQPGMKLDAGTYRIIAKNLATGEQQTQRFTLSEKGDPYLAFAFAPAKPPTAVEPDAVATPDTSGSDQVAAREVDDNTAEPIEAAAPNVERIPAALLPAMIDVPAGQYGIGCELAASECDGEERAGGTQVTLDAFAMAETEVSNELWAKCHDDGGCTRAASSGGNPKLPVTRVSYDDVDEFLSWLNEQTNGGYRLPSEAEWEAAAVRALDAVNNAGGDELNRCDYFNYADASSPYPWKDSSCSDGAGALSEVDELKTVGGFHHLLGNVWEMTNTCWVSTNPGPATADCSGARFTVKGGAFNNEAWRLRPSFRARARRGDQETNLGFRLVTSNG